MSGRKRAGLYEMAEVVGNEARRIRTVQAALVKIGDRTEPHPGEIRKAEVYEDIERLLFAIVPVREQVLKVLAPTMKAMRTAEEYPKQPPGSEAPAADDEKISDD